MEQVKAVAKNAVMGIGRMAISICCVASITFIDYIHTDNMEPMTAGTITAITLIAALGGVDVWKNGLLKR